MVACVEDIELNAEVTIESGIDAVGSAPWEALAASRGTVFHTARFLLSWWNDRRAKNPSSRLITAQVHDGGTLIGMCAFELDAGVLSFAGGCDVVDYMGPVALAGREREVAAALAQQMFDMQGWTHARFGGMPADDPASQAFIEELRCLVPSACVTAYDSSPRIEKAPEGYLALLNSKRRADVLRKRNRLTEAVGEVELVHSTPATVHDALDRLLGWKAQAGAATSEFVDEYGGFVESVVCRLAAADAARVVELHAAARPLASVITFAHRNTTYIYNMAYDMTLSEGAPTGLAPGVVLISHLVEQSLGQGRRFDFLKGAQDYKLRLGGVPVDLNEVTFARPV